MNNKYLMTACFALLVFVLHSCGTYYEYIQVLSTKPVNNLEKTSQVNGGILYADTNCAVFYKFWDNGGNAGFEFYNKTDKIIYLDLSKTFFIKNGIAYDYYETKTVTNTKNVNTSTNISYGYGLSATRSYSASISQYYAGNVGYGLSILLGGVLSGSTSTAVGQSTNISISNNPILSIPPKSSKFVNCYSIISDEIVSCDLKYYPEESDKITFEESNSPVTFSNYITFAIGNDTDVHSIENKFYVHEIANYIEQDVTDYIKREKNCENILTPTEIQQQKYEPEIFDAYIIIGDESSFYKTYKVFSSSRLYKKKQTGMYWNNIYQGYTRGSN
jgi:hypothetical protein